MKITKYTIRLSKMDRIRLKDITKKGTHNARVIKRAHILLLSDRGMAKDEVAARLAIGRSTVQRVRDSYRKDGMDCALYDAPRPGQPKKLDDKAEKYLIAVTCTDPPEGANHWTLELLAEKMVGDKKVKAISSVSIMRYLRRNGAQPSREKNVVHTRVDARVH